MSEVVTTLTVNTNTNAAHEFERAMDGAAEAAERATRSLADFGGMNSKMLLGLGVGAAAGAAAAAAGLDKMVRFVIDANREFAALDRMAKQTFTTTEKFQQLRFAGRAGGLSDDQFGQGLANTVRLMNDAQRGQNSLSKLFEANGLSIRQNNGHLLEGNQLLNRAAELVRNAANEVDKIKIAEMLGLTKEWIPTLEKGALAMNELARQANAAGVIISEETIKKAAQFDEEWRKVTVQFSAGFKEAIADVIPELMKLIVMATEAIKKMKEGDGQGNKGAFELSKGWADDAKQLYDSLSKVTWDDLFDKMSGKAQTATSRIDDATAALQNFFRISATLSGANGLVGSFSLGDRYGKDALSTKAVDEMTGAEADLVKMAKAANDEIERQKKLGKEAAEAAKAIAGVTRIPSTKDDPSTAVSSIERQINSINRRAAALEADAMAAGKTAGEHEKMRVTAQLQEVLWQQAIQTGEHYFTLLQKYGPAIDDAAERMKRAVDEVARLRESEQIVSSFGNALVSSLMRGDDLFKNLTASAAQLVQQLASKNLNRLLNGGSFFGDQQLGSAAGVVGMGSAALGGYQSANPLSGALGGAMAGASFGPWGMAIGGLLGAAGGFLGQTDQLNKAAGEWKVSHPEFASFLQPAASAAANDNRKEADERGQHHPVAA